MHSERPAPQMETERRAMKLIRLIVEAYLKGEGGGDWRFCLLASSILVDVAKNNLTEGDSINLFIKIDSPQPQRCFFEPAVLLLP